MATAAERPVRPYRAGDEAAILGLFERTFHRRRSEAHWRWKYVDNPYGRHRISVAVDREGGLLSHYAGYPLPFCRIEGGRTQRLLAHQIGDTMADGRAAAGARGLTSLLARTAKHFFHHYCEGRIAFNYGFNVGGIQKLVLRVSGGRFAERVVFRAAELPLGLPEHRRYRVDRATETTPSWDRFFKHAAPAYRFLLQRDAQYLRWRYLERPDAEYVLLAARRFRRLVGWGVFRRQADRLVWGDALVSPKHPSAAAALLSAAVQDPAFRGVGRVEAWFPERPRWWAAEVARLGLETRPEPASLGLIYATYTEPAVEEWMPQLYYTKGDSDLF